MGILANELRIGNWVKAPLGELLQVKQIGHPEKSDYILADTRFGFGQNELAGIPLTPEILEKCGAYKHSVMETGLVINLNDRTGPVLRVHEIYGGSGYYVPFNSHHEVKIQYLHQLQNLYFALTGAELEVKL